MPPLAGQFFLWEKFSPVREDSPAVQRSRSFTA